MRFIPYVFALGFSLYRQIEHDLGESVVVVAAVGFFS